MSTTTASRGFDADARAREREDQTVTIGGREFKPVRRTTKVMREVRRIGREQERLNRRSLKLEQEAEKALEAGDEDKAAELANQSDDATNEATGLTFTMLAGLLELQGDALEDVAGHIEEHLDLTDAEKLADHLMGGESPDPSAPIPSSTA